MLEQLFSRISGYAKVRGLSNLNRLWGQQLTLAFHLSIESDPLASWHKGSTAYTDKLERKHLRYICPIFQAAQKALGNQAPFLELTNWMNACS